MSTSRPAGRRLLALPVAVFMLAGLLPLGLPAPVAAVILAPPTLDAPASGATVSANPVFAWEAVSGAVRYRIEVSASPTFSPTIVGDETASLRYTPTTDLPVGTLYWQVAARDATNTLGTYQGSTFVKDWASAPNPTAPADGAVLTFPTDPLLFAWDALPGAQSYQLQVDDDDQFINPLLYSTKNTSFVVTEPKTSGQTFYWQVRGIAGTLVSAWSAPMTFSVQWPSVPTLVYPAQGQELTDLYFDWDPVPGASTYQIQVSPNGDWAGILTMDRIVKGTRYVPHEAALNNGAYFWRVRPRDASVAGNYGGWSEEREFERSWQPRPVPLTPANGDYYVETPTFSWTPVEHAAYYELQLSTDPNFFTWSRCYTNHTSYTPYGRVTSAGEPGECVFDPQPGQTYYWRVRGIDPPILNPGAQEPGVLGLWSNSSDLDVWSFVYVPAMPEPVDPPSGSTLEVPTLTWSDASGATKYMATIVKATGAIVSQGTTFATSWTPPTALNTADGPFRWYVQAYTFNNRWSPIPAQGSWWSFNLTPIVATASAPEQMAPADMASSYDMPALAWEPVVGADHYQVWYTNGSVYFQLGSDVDYPSMTFTTTSMSAGTYHWYVRAFSSQGADLGSSSDVWSFVIDVPDLLEPEAYVTPERCLPGGGCDPIADTPTLAWDPVPGALSYEVYVALDPNFTNKYREYSTSFTQLTPRESFVDNQAGQAFYWFVRPLRSNNSGRFDSQAQLNASAFQKRSEGIHRVAPAQDAHVANEITFEWQDFLAVNQGLTPPVTQEAKQYRVQVSSVADFASLLESPLIDEPFWTPWDKTYPEGPIYWRVQATDGSNGSLTFSSSGHVVKDSPPVVPMSPPEGGLVPGVPYLQWAPQDYAASYDVQIDEDPLFSTPILTTTTRMSAWTYAEPLATGTYYWRVRRNDADTRDGPWSVTRSFRLQPDSPTLIGPANGANPSPTTLVLQWMSARPAPKYTVELSVSPTLATSVSGFPVTTVMTSFAPKTLLTNGTYYWRVKALNASGTALATSGTGSFTVDSTRPSVTALSPASSATITSAFTVTFSEPVINVDDSTFVVTAAGSSTALAGTVSVLSPTSARFTPAALLVPGQTYTVALTSGVTDPVGNPLLPYSVNVRTATIVQQNSPAVRETWGRWTTSSANGGTMKMARTASSKLTFSFTGTGVSLVGYRGPYGGYASVYLDGVAQTSSLSFYSSASQYKRTLWTKTGLADGPHTVMVMARGTKPSAAKDTWVYVDAFVVGGVTYQESDPGVKDLFRAVSTSSASASSYDVASNVSATGRSGASLTFQFRGTGITWYATKGTASGKASVYIDNVYKGTVGPLPFLDGVQAGRLDVGHALQRAPHDQDRRQRNQADQVQGLRRLVRLLRHQVAGCAPFGPPPAARAAGRRCWADGDVARAQPAGRSAATSPTAGQTPCGAACRTCALAQVVTDSARGYHAAGYRDDRTPGR